VTDKKALLKGIPGNPGVYRMFDAKKVLLYVGKAKNLKKRVASYFNKHQTPRIQRLVEQIEKIEFTVTQTEAEALLLESNLIKQHRPRYNILLRDDKSYPYIYVTTEDDFPRLTFHRGGKNKPGRYFGPYPSAGAVRSTLNLLQKIFQVRQCEDSFFRNRSRPCLQYQIDRCSAPCVGKISKEKYHQDIVDSIRFLEGKSGEIINARVLAMEEAASKQEYEQAAVFRDQIESLRQISQQQYITGAKGEVDIVVCAMESGTACVQVFYIRAGSSLGNRSFFPRLPDATTSKAEILSAFISQYYSHREIPAELIVDEVLPDTELLLEMLQLRKGMRVKISHHVRGERARWLEMARKNAAISLQSQLSSKTNIRQRLEVLQEALDLAAIPQRMECFDISHTSGEATVASCVVFDEAGPRNSDYRYFNITGIAAGDDYAAMEQALTRRYKRLKSGEAPLPDILFIDGGKGQLAKAEFVLENLQIQGVTLIGVAKGEARKPGLETLFISGKPDPVIIPEHSPALHLIQQIRDEAHRFAITGHRKKRAKSRISSTLEGIPGLGPKRRKSLLQHFGGLRGISRASIEEIAKVPGISQNLAKHIYARHH